MTGSIDGIRVPHGDNFSYSASKAGIHMLARHMAHFMNEDHITVNSIAPGPFDSKMMGYLLDDPKIRAGIEATVPMRRIGRPEDVAGAVIFLAQPGRFVPHRGRHPGRRRHQHPRLRPPRRFANPARCRPTRRCHRRRVASRP